MVPEVDLGLERNLKTRRQGDLSLGYYLRKDQEFHSRVCGIKNYCFPMGPIRAPRKKLALGHF